MGTCPRGSVDDVAVEATISEAAIRTCGRLVAVLAGRVATHAHRDGGLILEDRANRARPRLWRITPEGVVDSDCSYNFTRQAFVRVPLPQEANA